MIKREMSSRKILDALQMIDAEPLCKVCDNHSQGLIIKMRYVRTILNPESIKIYHCPICHRDYTEYQAIWSNMTWLYIEEDKERGDYNS